MAVVVAVVVVVVVAVPARPRTRPSASLARGAQPATTQSRPARLAWYSASSARLSKVSMTAARVAAFAHGLAGDRAAERWGEIGVTATDLIDELPGALAELVTAAQPPTESE